MIDRRRFTAASLVTLAFAGLPRIAGASQAGAAYRNEVPGYGPLEADPAGLFDLPRGFSYRILSSLGDRMSDGFLVPDAADGMGCFALGGSKVALVRNHELRPRETARGGFGGADIKGYDRNAAGTLPGGTTTIVYDTAAQRVEAQYRSLAGTIRNCAGGPTPWGSWLTCEEDETLPGEDGVGKSHGWVFEVPAAQRGLAEPVPIAGMGRFYREAAAVDPRTGIVYLTEDQGDGLFYRFLPDSPGALHKGGRLQALGVVAAPRGGDTRNWKGITFPPGTKAAAFWVDLEGTDNPDLDLRKRGHAKGAALFARSEGMHLGNEGEIYVMCTSGGAAECGQVFRYRPSRFEGQAGEKDAPGTLELFVESRDPKVLNYGDNIVVAPWGHLIVCEDGDEPNHLRGITPAGDVYTLARLHVKTELAGACFSPDGSTLFVNVHRPTRTLAIAGPWRSVRAAPPGERG